MNRSHTKDQEVKLVDPLTHKHYHLYAEVFENEGHVVVDHRSMWETWPNGRQKAMVLNSKEVQWIFCRCVEQLIKIAGEQARKRLENVARHGQPPRVRNVRGRRLYPDGGASGMYGG